tara:strand:- start:1315 stop:3501 length:2187 start_codon:yes stop_codon:yes gene_type:complete
VTVAQSTVQFGCCIRLHEAPGLGVEVLDGVFDEVLQPLLAAVSKTQDFRFSLSLSGTLLDHALGRHPSLLKQLAGLQREGRLEWLGGGHYDPVLSAIPERDALGQLQYSARFLEQHLGCRPQGVWLPLLAYDPVLPPLLTRARFKYTFVDSAQLVGAGCQERDLDGYFLTERGGQSLGLFPLHRQLSARLLGDPKEFANWWQEYGVDHHTDDGLLLCPLDARLLVKGGALEGLLGLLEEHSSWIKTVLPSSYLQRQPPRGRVYLSAGVAPELARWLRPAEAGRRYRDLGQALAGLEAGESLTGLMGPVLWENALVKYPEANRLHKRMLRVSHRLDKVRAAVSASAARADGEQGLEQARKVLARACSGLWQAQSHSFYWHGPAADPGVYSAYGRRFALQQLLAVERTIDRLLKDPCERRWTMSRADFDADGAQELLVRTPQFSAMIHPRLGAELVELDLRERMLPLQSGLSPLEEPAPLKLTGTELALVFDDPLQAASWEGGAGSLYRRSRTQQEARARGAFLDRFLGPEASLESFARRQFRELGDFSSGEYEAQPIPSPDDGAPGRITLSKSGVVRDVDDISLLRIDKTYLFGVRHPRMTLELELVNRSRDPAKVWYGLEWSLGELGAAAAPLVLKGGCEDEPEHHCELGPKGVEFAPLNWLNIGREGGDLRLALRFSEPLGVWCVPVRCEQSTQVQGHSLLFHAPVEIWGEDSWSLNLQVDFITGTS